MKERRNLLVQHRNKTAEFIQLNKTIKQKVKEDIAKYHEDLVENTIERNRGIKCLCPTLGNNKVINAQNQQGIEERNLNKIAQIVENYYKDLLKSQTTPDENTKENLKEKIQNIGPEEILDIEPYEIIKAIRELKNNKVPGADEILAEMLKGGKHIIMAALTGLFNEYLHRGKFP